MPEELMAVIIVGVVGFVLIVLASIAGGVIQAVLKTREKERTRREIAAYVAEGSMTPDEGVKLMDAGRPAWERELWHKRNA
jgi:hypothetical protein